MYAIMTHALFLHFFFSRIVQSVQLQRIGLPAAAAAAAAADAAIRRIE